MIPFDFAYYLPDTATRAVNLYSELQAAGKKPLYYGGGTEIISMARVNEVSCDAVIDIKNIPECNQLSVNNQDLTIGAGLTLSRIQETNLFPLLTKSAGRIADHTIQGKITLGGNLCGTIIYKEVVLPFLLCDSLVLISSKTGLKTIPFAEFFKQKPLLKAGEILLQVIVPKSFLALPFIHAKKTKQDKIDYPLLTIAALKHEQQIRVAFSGLAAFPFRAYAMEKILNDPSLTVEEKAEQSVLSVEHPILGDLLGSVDYRRFVLKNSLINTLQQLEGE